GCLAVGGYARESGRHGGGGGEAAPAAHLPPGEAAGGQRPPAGPGAHPPAPQGAREHRDPRPLHHPPPDPCTYFARRPRPWVRLAYTIEETPLGTAGSVKQAEGLLGESDFLIISGDSLTDLDIGRFVAYHQERRALATLALVRVDQPLEYGVVVTGADGRITHFMEKPGWSEVRSDTINTGIYCLNSRILAAMEPGRAYDWSSEIFPQALTAGEPLYGYRMDGYWCDVGSFQAYRESQADALGGRVELEIPGALQAA